MAQIVDYPKVYTLLIQTAGHHHVLLMHYKLLYILTLYTVEWSYMSVHSLMLCSVWRWCGVLTQRPRHKDGVPSREVHGGNRESGRPLSPDRLPNRRLRATFHRQRLQEATGRRRGNRHHLPRSRTGKLYISNLCSCALITESCGGVHVLLVLDCWILILFHLLAFTSFVLPSLSPPLF